MGIISVFQYTAECDYCRYQLDDLYDDELDAEEAAKASGWQTRGFELFCEECMDDPEEEHIGS